MLHKSKLFEMEIFGSYMKTLHIFQESALRKLSTIAAANGVQKTNIL
jgi:hypothetical protein